MLNNIFEAIYVAYTSIIAIALFCKVVQLYLATDLNYMHLRKSYAHYHNIVCRLSRLL